MLGSWGSALDIEPELVHREDAVEPVAECLVHRDHVAVVGLVEGLDLLQLRLGFARPSPVATRPSGGRRASSPFSTNWLGWGSGSTLQAVVERADRRLKGTRHSSETASLGSSRARRVMAGPRTDSGSRVRVSVDEQAPLSRAADLVALPNSSSTVERQAGYRAALRQVKRSKESPPTAPQRRADHRRRHHHLRRARSAPAQPSTSAAA